MKKFLLVILSLAAFSPLFGQQPTPTAPPAPQSQEVIVKIQQQAPEAPKTVAAKANEWVDFGKNVGSAMDAGLSSLTEHAEKFSQTDAGKFTMAIIAWKVAGHEATALTERLIHVAVGVPILIVWIFVSVYFWRKTYCTRREVIERSGFWLWGTRKYQVVSPDMDNPGPWISGIIAVIVAFIIIGAVIL